MTYKVDFNRQSTDAIPFFDNKENVSGLAGIPFGNNREVARALGSTPRSLVLQQHPYGLGDSNQAANQQPDDFFRSHRIFHFVRRIIFSSAQITGGQVPASILQRSARRVRFRRHCRQVTGTTSCWACPASIAVRQCGQVLPQQYLRRLSQRRLASAAQLHSQSRHPFRA